MEAILKLRTLIRGRMELLAGSLENLPEQYPAGDLDRELARRLGEALKGFQKKVALKRGDGK